MWIRMSGLSIVGGLEQVSVARIFVLAIPVDVDTVVGVEIISHLKDK